MLGRAGKIPELVEVAARVLTKRSRGMRELDVSVKDSRGSGAIAKLLILVLVSSSAEDRSNPRDRARSSRCGNTASRLFSSEAEESIYLLISITIQFLAAGARARVGGWTRPASALYLLLDYSVSNDSHAFLWDRLRRSAKGEPSNLRRNKRPSVALRAESLPLPLIAGTVARAVSIFSINHFLSNVPSERSNLAAKISHRYRYQYFSMLSSRDIAESGDEVRSPGERWGGDVAWSVIFTGRWAHRANSK